MSRFLSVFGSVFWVFAQSDGYVYETFGISKHFLVKLQVLLIRAETFDNALTAKCFIYDVMRLPFLFSIILFVKFVHYFNVFVRKFVNYKVHYFCWNLFVKCRSNSTCYASNSVAVTTN